MAVGKLVSLSIGQSGYIGAGSLFGMNGSGIFNSVGYSNFEIYPREEDYRLSDDAVNTLSELHNSKQFVTK